MVIGAADMIRRHGLNATSVRELAKHAGAPLGATYHYFPGGKQQLAAAAVRWAGDTVARALERRLEDGPVEGLRALLAVWRRTLTDSDFRAGCPVLAVSVEESAGDTELLATAAEIFGRRESMLARSLRNPGAGKRKAAQLATLIVAGGRGHRRDVPRETHRAATGRCRRAARVPDQRCNQGLRREGRADLLADGATLGAGA